MKKPAFKVITRDNNEVVGTFKSIMHASHLAKKIGLHLAAIETVWMDEAIWNGMA